MSKNICKNMVLSSTHPWAGLLLFSIFSLLSLAMFFTDAGTLSGDARVGGVFSAEELRRWDRGCWRLLAGGGVVVEVEVRLMALYVVMVGVWVRAPSCMGDNTGCSQSLHSSFIMWHSLRGRVYILENLLDI